MQQAESTPPTSTETVPEAPLEITHVPLWVKGIVAIGAVLFVVQMPGFMSSLSDAIQKNRAAKAFEAAQFAQAIDGYKVLHERYPRDLGLIKRLGFSYYRAGQYVESIETFNQLSGKTMTKSDVDEINAVISEMAEKLKRTAR